MAAATSTRRHGVAHQELELEPHGPHQLGGIAAAVLAVVLAVPARPGARRSVLAGDVAHELGRLAEGGSNLDPLGGAGAAVERAGAVLAVLAALALEVAQALLGERCGRRWPPRPALRYQSSLPERRPSAAEDCSLQQVRCSLQQVPRVQRWSGCCRGVGCAAPGADAVADAIVDALALRYSGADARNLRRIDALIDGDE
jgi:hypothetical protein